MRGLGQKYMGGRPETHADAMFKNTAANIESNHPVPISNFMNAQCTSTSMLVPVFVLAITNSS